MTLHTLFLLTSCLNSPKDSSSITTLDTSEDNIIEWNISVENDERGAYLSAWSPNEEEVWVVGGLPSAGVIIKGNENIGWQDVAIPESTPLLNWIHGTSDTDIWVGGLYGTILHWNGSEWEDHSQDMEEAIWGIFVRENDGKKEIVAVGGESKWGGTQGIIWKYDGDTWQSIDLPAEISTVSNLFKVTHDGSHYWIVGVSGTLLYGDIDQLLAVPTGITADLITVSPSPSREEVLIVGGRGTGVYFWGQSGTLNTEQSQQSIAGLNGVFVTEEKSMMVGEMGYGLIIDSQSPYDSEKTEPMSMTRDILHATTAIESTYETTFYAVGGNLAAINDDYHGVILTYSLPK